MKEKVMQGKPYAGNPHVRFDEGAGAPKRSGRSALLYKRMKIATVTIALFTNGIAHADPVTLYSKETIPQNFKLASAVWTNSAGEVVSWGDYNDGNAIAYFWHAGASASSFTLNNPVDPFRAYGLAVEHSGTWIFWEMRVKPLVLGAGGIDVKRGRFFFGYNSETELQLAADQTWTGSGESASYDRYFNVGGISGKVRYTKLVANEGVTSLSIAGKLQTSLYAPDNQLEDVTVTVTDDAKLWLIDLVDARLNAKKLVLDGDGAHMAFGTVLPVKSWYYPTASAYAPTNVVAMDNFHLAPEVELANGADVTAKGGIYAVSNLVVSGTGESVISGDLMFTQAVSRVTFATVGASLAFITANAVADGVSAGFAVTGPGTLKLVDVVPFTGALYVSDGARLEYTPSASTDFRSPLSGDGTFSVNAGDGVAVYLPAGSMADFTGGIVVESGTLILDAELAEGRVTVNGGSVVYASVDPFIVTDAVRSDSAITVSSNETLQIYGNGLTASTAVTLAGGTLKFMRNGATVASPITVTAPGYAFESSALAVTGVVSGKITASIPGANETGGVRMRGPGCIWLTGGGDFTGKPNSFESYDGSAVFADGEWIFHNCMHLGCHYTAQRNTNPGSTCGKRWTVRGNAVLKIDGYNSNYTTHLRASGHAHSSSYNYESFIDVVDGGTVELGGNAQIVAGYYMARGTLRIANGGIVKATKTSSAIMLGNSVTAWGVLRLEEGGRLELSAPILRKFHSTVTYQPQGQFVWAGGTVKLNANFSESEATLLRHGGTAPSSEDPAVVEGLRIWTRIDGESCVLDLTDLPERETPLANVPAGFDRAEWFGTGTLTVKGGKPFTMNSFGSGLGLALEGYGTSVIFPDNAQFHDYAARVATQNVEPGSAHYSTLTNLLSDVSLKSFASKGRNVSLLSENATNTLSVSEVSVAMGGEFANDTITFPGGLEVTNLVFAANAVIGGNGAVPTLRVLGDIVLPETLCYCVRRNGTSLSPFTAFCADGGLSAAPSVWTNVGARNVKCVVDGACKTVGFVATGMQVIVR